MIVKMRVLLQSTNSSSLNAADVALSKTSASGGSHEVEKEQPVTTGKISKSSSNFPRFPPLLHHRQVCQLRFTASERWFSPCLFAIAAFSLLFSWNLFFFLGSSIPFALVNFSICLFCFKKLPTTMCKHVLNAQAGSTSKATT